MTKRKADAKKKRKASPKQRHASPAEVLIRQKLKRLLDAEQAFWQAQKGLWKQYDEFHTHLSNLERQEIPSDISSTVWGLRDGAALVRYKTPKGKPTVNVRVADITLEQWGKEGLIVVLPQGELSLAKSGFRGTGNITLVNCQFNDIHVPFVEFVHLKYGDKSQYPKLENALLDFQLTVLGLIRQRTPDGKHLTSGAIEKPQTIGYLKDTAISLEKLLTQRGKEEQLQTFLKTHPFILDVAADQIPKQKLGEDFVTDFVLVSPSDQGPRYTLVELEQSTHPVLTSDGSYSHQTTHAIKQTRDWDIWLEKNQAYIQQKLPSFEKPCYLIVIGRGLDLSENQKTYLRSYNRDLNNTEILTYDDILYRFKAVISKFEKIASPELLGDKREKT